MTSRVPVKSSQRVQIAVAALGLAAFLTAACGSGSSNPTTLPPTSTPAPSTVPGTDAPTSTTAVPVTATLPPVTASTVESDTACGALDPLLGSARIISVLDVDWSGNGRADAQATLYETAPDTADYRLRVERDGVGSEMAIVMSTANLPTQDTTSSSATPAGSRSPGEPELLAAVQVDGTGEPSPVPPNPQELIVRVAIVPAAGSGSRETSSGYDVGIFYNDLAQRPEGCISRFHNADGNELVIPIRAGGWSGSPKSGLACDNNPVGRPFTDYLVRTGATRVPGKNTVFDTIEITLVRGGTLGAPSGSTADQLLEGEDITGRVVDYGSPTGPLLRYSALSGCGLGGDVPSDIPNDDGTVDTIDEGVAD